MNVILQGDGSPFGVLEVDSTSEGEFGEHDITFLQGAANILGMAISNNDINESCKPRLIVIRYCSRKSTTASRTAYRWFRLCFNSKLTRLTTRL